MLGSLIMFVKKLKEIFFKLPGWLQGVLGVIVIFALVIFWELVIYPRIEWLKGPIGYILGIIIYGGIASYSGYWIVKVTIGALLSIPSKFGEVKMKEVPRLFGYLFIYLIWLFFTLTFLGAAINILLDPFDMSLQSLGILPHMYPGYFLDNPVYIFGYKIIPIFD